MNLTVNGEPREHDDGGSLELLLIHMEVNRAHVAVMVNNDVVKRVDFADTVLNDGDRVEIVIFAGGGRADNDE